MKPKVILERLLSDIKNKINIATNKKLFSYKSISIVSHARTRTRELLVLFERIFEDLWESKNKNDINYTPSAIAYALLHYSKNKKYTDKDKNWWFPVEQKEIKASNKSMLPIKLNYELQGRGTLHIGSSNYEWFEEQCSFIFKKIELHAVKQENGEGLLLSLISAYQMILCGDYSQDSYGRYYKSDLGLYENQQFASFGQYMDSYIALYDKLKTGEELSSYLNGCFALGLTIVEGFDYSKYENAIDSLINESGQLIMSRKEVELLDLPDFFYFKLLDYWERLDAEVQCEGRVITPREHTKKELLEYVTEVEGKYFTDYFKKICEHQDKIIESLRQKGNHKELAQCLKIRFEWFSRMFFLGKFDYIENNAGLLTKQIIYLPFLPKEVLIDSEFWEEIEKLIFPAIINNRLKLFKGLCLALTLVLKTINSNQSDTDSLIYRNRILVIIGAFTHLVSELNQDNLILLEFLEIMDDLYNEDIVIQMFDLLANPKLVGGTDLTIKLIGMETTRYHHWFVDILRKIGQLPKTYAHVRVYSGMQLVADHPSELIRELSYHLPNPQEDSIKSFVEYVKKREGVKKLVKVLKNYKK